MKRSQDLDSKLQRLALVARDLPAESALDEFRKALQSSNHTVVARAAQLAGRAKAYDLVPALVDAMARLVAMPAASDKGCTAKMAIARALEALDCQQYEPFLLGVKHIQLEPAYGEPVDTAAELRGECAITLARMHYPDIYFLALDLLFDKERNARLAAATVLGAIPGEASELLLRMKLRLPEEDPGVVQKCFAGLLNVNADRSWEFVERFLRSSDSQKAESAALAIGESHDERAYPTLRSAVDDIATSESKRVLLLAMVLTRNDQAVEYLLEQVKTGSPGRAALALEALSVNSADLRVREMVLDAVESRQDRRIDEVFRRCFG